MTKIKEFEKYLAKLEVFMSVFQGKKNQRRIEETSTVFGAGVERGENAECYKISKRA